MEPDRDHRSPRLLVAVVAAFCTYFCMYAFRKPFTAGTYEGQEYLGLGLKSVLVISQLLGYMLSKFIGIKVVSEMPGNRRAVTIIGLILTAELALIGFAYAPVSLKVVMLFLNGLPLGMVFGLVLAYLEGRKQTEALTAGLCASFIVSSGVVKSVGRWLVVDLGVSEFHMPMLTGLLFLPPLLLSVWILQATPPPNARDRALRRERSTMNRKQRWQFVRAYLPGLSLLVAVYVALTVVRTVRDDFGVEIWRDLGVSEQPAIFAHSETVVAVVVTALNGMAIWIKPHLSAMRATIALMCMAFAAVLGVTLMQVYGLATPFLFMVGCGIGLYLPYVAFHTTVFERLVAASRRPSNLAFLMYLADAAGYLGYAVVIAMRTAQQSPTIVLPFFRVSLLVVAIGSMAALAIAWGYFHRVLPAEARAAEAEGAAP